jgi:hypothetical protein
MTTPTQPQHLRAAATRMRALAASIGSSRALTVYRLGGLDTWIGPTPQRCDDALRTIRRQLQSAQQSSSDIARSLDRRADAVQHQLSISTLAQP